MMAGCHDSGQTAADRCRVSRPHGVLSHMPLECHFFRFFFYKLWLLFVFAFKKFKM